ncbi:MAG: class I SAM-dependent methyltransferase [Pseudomonadota bacterium]
MNGKTPTESDAVRPGAAASERGAQVRDYSTISPSALSLLLMKAQSSVPFAKQAATLLWGDSAPSGLADAIAVAGAPQRLRHFENRYFSLDRLLNEAALPRVLEVAAGLSFRGLELARTNPRVFYIDTDLPEIIALKADLVARLHPAPLTGTLRVQPLNVLDDDAFRATVDALPAGPIAIANEGLLVYLDAEEKARLAANVRAALRARGGVWLTADIYIRHPLGAAPTVGYGRSRQFLEQHRVEENKFASWLAAEVFFNANGFKVVKKLAHHHPRHIRQSWALALAP